MNRERCRIIRAALNEALGEAILLNEDRIAQPGFVTKAIKDALWNLSYYEDQSAKQERTDHGNR